MAEGWGSLGTSGPSWPHLMQAAGELTLAGPQWDGALCLSLIPSVGVPLASGQPLILELRVWPCVVAEAAGKTQAPPLRH